MKLSPERQKSLLVSFGARNRLNITDKSPLRKDSCGAFGPGLRLDRILTLAGVHTE